MTKQRSDTLMRRFCLLTPLPLNDDTTYHRFLVAQLFLPIDIIKLTNLDKVATIKIIRFRGKGIFFMAETHNVFASPAGDSHPANFSRIGNQHSF